MKKLKSIIIENDPKSLSLLSSLISDHCPELEVVSTATNIQDAVKQILHLKPDLIFLDIELNDGLGFDVLYQIPDNKFKTIIITGFSSYAFDAFKFGIEHYLLKPVSVRELRISIDRILQDDKVSENYQKINATLEHLSLSQKKIQISTNKGIKLINLNEIEFLQADGSYTVFHLTNKNSIIASKHLKNFESILSESNFFRIGRTHIINLDHVKIYNKFGGETITMKNGSKIVVPRRKKDEFLQYMNSYLKALK